MSKNEKPEFSFDKQNDSTKKKSKPRKKDKQNPKNISKLDVSKFEQDTINIINLPEKQEDEVKLEKLHTLEGLNEEQWNKWIDMMKLDQNQISLEQKLLVINIWNQKFEEYKNICDKLHLRQHKFDTKLNLNDEKIDKVIKDMKIGISNTKLNLIMYITKRIMVEFMTKIDNSTLNLLTFFMFNTMMDILELKEMVLSSLGAKNIFEVILDEMCAKLDEENEMEKRLEAKILDKISGSMTDNNKIKAIIVAHEKTIAQLERKLQLLEESTKSKDAELETSIKVIQNSYMDITAKLEVYKKNWEKIPIKYVNLDPIYGKIRQIHARCNGLHERIKVMEDDIEDIYNQMDVYEPCKQEDKNIQPKEVSDHESDWEEIENEEEEEEEDLLDN
jgi:hypothetical protein